MADEISPKNGIVVLLLFLSLGIFGIHRFYAGRIVTGIIYLLTGSIIGFGWIYDLIILLTGKFKDGEGKKIEFN